MTNKKKNKALGVTKERLNRAYRERLIAAVLAAKLALRCGYAAGVGRDENAEETWSNVLYIDLPNGGQISWHVSPADVDLIVGLPEYTKPWDGTWESREGKQVRRIQSTYKPQLKVEGDFLPGYNFVPMSHEPPVARVVADEEDA